MFTENIRWVFHAIHFIKANISAYFDYIFSNLKKDEKYLKIKPKLVPIFEKYAPKIVDYLFQKKVFSNIELLGSELPFLIFHYATIGACNFDRIREGIKKVRTRLTTPQALSELGKLLQLFSDIDPRLEREKEDISVFSDSVVNLTRFLLVDFTESLNGNERSEICILSYFKKEDIYNYCVLFFEALPSSLVKSIVVDSFKKEFKKLAT